MASQIRHEVNTAIFERVVGLMPLPDRLRLDALLVTSGPTRKSPFNRLKQSAGRASWSAFREQVEHLRWVDSLGDTGVWLAGVAESKIADFGGEAGVADAAVMGDVAPLKRTALLACMVHVARAQARDDLAEMFCKRMASITKRSRNELDEIRARQAEMSERLIAHYRDLLGYLDPRSPAAAEALRLARAAVENAGGFDAELADIEAVAAHHANNYMPLVVRHWRRDRATMFAFVHTVDLEATSADRSVLDAVEHASAHSHLTRDYIPDHMDGTVVDLSFVSEPWQRLIRDRGHPGRLQRRHFEACVFSYVAGELRTGDIAVTGSQAYANWSAQLLGWDKCQALLGEFCAEGGLPDNAAAFTGALRSLLVRSADAVGAGYPDNADLVIDEGTGVPSLKRRHARERTASSLALEEAVKERMPEPTLLEILARTAYWLEWWRRFGPASGSDLKLADPLLRYVLTTFAYGTNLGPAQAARHIRGVSAHELGATAGRHFSIDKLNLAGADVVNAYLRLDLVNALGRRHERGRGWHPGRHADGQPAGRVPHPLRRLRRDRLPPRSRQLHRLVFPLHPLRGVGSGLHHRRAPREPVGCPARHHPRRHQGQSYPVHALAHLFGFELLPRIRNWKDLIFYRSAARYRHIDSLFGPPGQNTINWRLIETHWADLMQVVLSIRKGRLSSTLLLRRLGTESHKNNLYKAFRELGRVIRTVTLLRFISEPDLREEITAATNKVEA